MRPSTHIHTVPTKKGFRIFFQFKNQGLFKLYTQLHIPINDKSLLNTDKAIREALNQYYRLFDNFEVDHLRYKGTKPTIKDHKALLSLYIDCLNDNGTGELFFLGDQSSQPTDYEIDTHINEFKSQIAEFKDLFHLDAIYDIQNQFIKEKSHIIKKGTLKIYTDSFRLLNQYRINNNISTLNHIDKKYISGFIQFMRSLNPHLTDNTIKNRLRSINSFLRWAYHNDLRSSDQIPLQSIIRINQATDRVTLTNDEIDRILSYSTKSKAIHELQTIVRLNLSLGLRFGELRSLTKASFFIDNENNLMLKVIEDKTNEERLLPIIENRSYIESRLKTMKLNDRLVSINLPYFNKLLKHIGKEVGITDVFSYQNTQNGKRVLIQKEKWELLSSHCLRKTSIQRNLNRFGYDVAKSLSGHKTEKAFKSYSKGLDIKTLIQRLKENQ